MGVGVYGHLLGLRVVRRIHVGVGGAQCTGVNSRLKVAAIEIGSAAVDGKADQSE